MPDYAPISPEDNRIAKLVFACALKVHTELGPGLLESVYAGCLAHETAKAGLAFRREVGLPVVYDDVRFEAGYRIDFLSRSGSSSRSRRSTRSTRSTSPNCSPT